jgi:hypothetical protein
LHAGKSFDDSKGGCDAAKNFKRWNEVMNKNWEKKFRKKPLIAHLTRFWDVETPYAKAID